MYSRPWVRRFLMEHLPDDRNLSRNTQQSYRDALRLLIVFAAGKVRKKADRLLLADIDANLVRVFLRHLEEERGCTISTRNQRLAAYHAFAAFVRCSMHRFNSPRSRNNVVATQPSLCPNRSQMARAGSFCW